jgi:hypothetical protein
MDTKTLFQVISRKMRADFDASTHVVHHGSRGTVRENILRSFLAEGRLPFKYGLGAGEIVGRIKETSRQCDIIIYDRLDGVILLYDEHTQVYPIDCVYGIIEVKSALSKAELIDSLDKIAAFKAMAPEGKIQQLLGGTMTLTSPRSKPFGVVFAYDLVGNSLDSLVQNLREWERDKDPELWPNYICVLERGVIFHHGSQPFDRNIDSNKIKSECFPSALHLGEDSLFNFYCTLHDMCANVKLGPVELLNYYEPAVRIGRFIIDGKLDFIRTEDGKSILPKEAMIAKIVQWCAAKGPMRYSDVLRKQFGKLPLGLDDKRILDRKVFLYNPDDLPGLHELGSNPFIAGEDGAHTTRPCLVPTHEIAIDGHSYVLCMASFAVDDFEESED